MGPYQGVVRVTRTLAWVLTIGSVLVVAASFASLPETLPVSRWHSEKKTLFFALRIPLINLLTLAVVEVLGRSLFRSRLTSTSFPVIPILSVTAGLKATLECIELRLLPDLHAILTFSIVFTVLSGLSLSAWYGRRLFEKNSWKELKPTFAEKISLAIFVFAIMLLNLPVLSAMTFRF